MRTAGQHQVVIGKVWGREAYGGDEMTPDEIGQAIEVGQEALGLSDLGLARGAGVSVKMLRWLKSASFKRMPSGYAAGAIRKLLAYFEKRSKGGG